MLRNLSVSQFVVVVSALNMALFHLPLYHFALSNLDMSSYNGILILFILFVVVFSTTLLSLYMLGFFAPIALKPFCIITTVLNASALYFVVTYKIILDRTMLANILNTRSEESLDFLHPKLFIYVIVFGVLPAWLISKIRIQPLRRLKLLKHFITTFVLLLVFVYINSSTWLWFDQHSKKLGGVIMPWSYLINTVRAKAAEQRSHKNLTLLPTGSLADDNKLLLVLVIGETARSKNFSLYGYERNTNPNLAEADIAVLKGARSCSTYTTASLHCLLSHTGQTSGSEEPLPSYLQRHGVDVIWRSNNWGEPPLLVESYETAKALREQCNGELCGFDHVLLEGLAERINSSKKRKIFVTLHTKGSHGPAYHTRYPEKLSKFIPTCDTVELDKCDTQSLINAYDNTILATDDFLYRTIHMLENDIQMPVLFLYISDHGESLGEFGLYLHGTPYAIAPDVQKNIPFIIWMSKQYRNKQEVSIADLEKPETHSQYQVFHTILGAFGLSSPVYQRELDIFNQ